MQRTVIIFGLIAGGIIILLGAATRPIWIGADGTMDMRTGEVLGYISMIIALSMIFFGIRQYRERHLGGVISFGKAFKAGILITLVASIIYMAGWMIYYYSSEMAQTFPEQYLEHMKTEWVKSGISDEEVADKTAKLEKNMAMFDNPVIMAGVALMEIFPVGLIITLLSAFLLKKRT